MLRRGIIYWWMYGFDKKGGKAAEAVFQGRAVCFENLQDMPWWPDNVGVDRTCRSTLVTSGFDPDCVKTPLDDMILL